jgi:hypothetical protein
MATWKKVLVSGSDIHVSSVTASNLTNDNLTVIGTAGQLESSGLTFDGTTLDLSAAAAVSASIISGSIFSGSFVGDGSGLTGLATNLSFSGSTGGDVVDLLNDVFTITGGTAVTTAATDNTLTINVQDASTSQKGIARFDSGDFGVSSGLVTLANSTDGAVLSIAGTTNEVDVSRTNGTVTVGLPNDVTVGNNLTVTNLLQVNGNTILGNDSADTVRTLGDLTVGGSLTVDGELTFTNSDNLLIKDQFILLNSGSNSDTDSGIIFGGTNGVAQSGSALIWDASYNTNDGRLAIVSDLASNATGQPSPAYHIAGVFEGTEANAATANADHVGNIRVESGQIYIYV